MDSLDKISRSNLMSLIKNNGSILENNVFKALNKLHIRFTKNSRFLYGKPDISIKKYKIAVFIDSCFWHGCKYHCRKPKSNIEYWEKKISNNLFRDIEVNAYYITNDWYLLRLWEHDIISNFENSIYKIKSLIDLSKKYQ